MIVILSEIIRDRRQIEFSLQWISPEKGSTPFVFQIGNFEQEFRWLIYMAMPAYVLNGENAISQHRILANNEPKEEYRSLLLKRVQELSAIAEKRGRGLLLRPYMGIPLISDEAEDLAKLARKLKTALLWDRHYLDGVTPSLLNQKKRLK